MGKKKVKEQKEPNYFEIGELIDLNENQTLTIVDKVDHESKAVVVIKDSEIKVYYPDKKEEDDYTNKFEDLVNKVREDNCIFIKSAKGESRWEEFNPNPKGKNVGDCSIRAYCAVNDDLTWDKAFDIACVVAKDEKDIINSGKVCHKILTEELGYELDQEYKKVKPKERITVQEFCLTHNFGKYVLSCAKHLVGVVDGRYYDSYSSGDMKVKDVYFWPEVE